MKSFIQGINKVRKVHKVYKVKISNLKSQIGISNLKFYEIILLIFITVFILIFSFLSIKRYKTLNSYYYDLGIMNQVVYNTSRGRILEMTNQDLMKNVSRFAIHFDPIIVIFAPFYWIYSGPEVLLVGQSIILGLGAIAIWLICQKILKNKPISLLFSLLYLMYFGVQRAVLFDFHAVTLVTTFFLFALYFQETKKWQWFYFFIILSLLTKEHVGLVVFMLGLYQIIFKKEKKIGLITSTIGLFFFILTVYFIIPYFRGSEHFASGYFIDIRSRIRSIIGNGFNYTKMILTPNLYSIFAPFALLISTPEWAINIISKNNNLISYYFHYSSIIVSFLFYSMIFGYRNFDRLIKNKLIKKIIFIIFIILNIYSIYKYNPIPYFVKDPVRYQELSPTTKKSIELWKERLKEENVIVSTTPKLAPFFTNRITYLNFLYDPAYAEMGKIDDDIIKTIDDYKTADYVVIYRPEIGEIAKQTIPVKFYQELRNDSHYLIIYSDDLNGKSIEVYKKI